MPLLVDLGGVPDECCDGAFEELVKAQSFGEVSHLWDRVPNRFAADHIEAVSARLEAILTQLRAMLAGILSGHPEMLLKADAPWLRWDEARFELVRRKLWSMTPDSMTLADYEILIEWIIARYLSDDVIQTEAEYLAVRAALMGKIESNLSIDRRVTNPMIGHIVELLPTSFAQVPPHVLTPLEAAMMDYGRAHAAEAIRGVAEGVRHRMATVVMQHVQAGILGQREGTTKHLQTALFDQFSNQNRDMRRVAVTETGEIGCQAYVMNMPTGSRVKRIESYRGACDFCRSINGKEFEVVAADSLHKDGSSQIWVGKTNVGRSASPMKREGDRLVERPDDERWWAASGLMHPNCRGAWVPVTDRPPEVSEQFAAWLQSMLDRAEAGHPA